MDEHYFSQTPSSNHSIQHFTISHAGRMLRFETDAGVFSKGHLDQGTALLLSALPDRFSGHALDLGCGWGAVGVCLAAQWPDAQITMLDINERAVALSRKNLDSNGLSASVHQSDGLALWKGAPFDLIATNPPIRAGKAVVYRLFEESVQHLSPGGALYVVIRKQQGADSAKKHLAALLDPVEVVARGGGFRVLRGIRR